MRKSSIGYLASLPDEGRRAFLDSLSGNALRAMPWVWELWAHEGHQLAPAGDWQTWVILGGRGAGKTRAGAEWVRAQVEGATPLAPGRCRRIALLGETLEQVRAVMVEGDSGLLACAAPDRRPRLIASQHKLVWENGAEAMLASATSYEALRGPQFDCAWSDELAKWKHAREAWDMLQFALRLGNDPRQIVTTTPRDNAVLIDILGAPETVVTKAATGANRAHLAPGFLERMEARYGGTWLGRQELGGELMRERAGALWTRGMIEAARGVDVPALERIVVAVDPPVTSGAGSDECGIVVAGAADGEAWVLADHSARGLSPRGWAERAVEAYREFGADRLVAEVNQGGDLVETLVRQVDPSVAYRKVHATRGKRLRAEPVAALYEQGRVRHAGAFPELEDQLCQFEGGAKSPDRLDALVWALTDLLLETPKPAPRVRLL